MKRYFNIIYKTVILFVLTSCAIQVGPQGGPKDILPPVIIKEEPPNNTVNFDKDKITLFLNEYSKLNEISQEMIISPLITPIPKISTKKKSISLKFEQKLKENTTYTIQFGKSIADITENNILADYTYIFSTGPKLDSLEIKGKAREGLTSTNKENIKVILHLLGNDSSIYKFKPEYYTKTKKDGEFVFKNLHTNKYRIYALDDENGNYLFDKGERIAFANEPIELNKNIEKLELNLFKENEEKLKIIDFGSVEIKKYFLAFNAPVDSLRISQIINGSPNTITKNIKINETHDSAYFWLNQETDTLKLIVDLWGENDTKDTLLININLNKKEVRQKPPAKLSIKLKNNLYTSSEIYIEFNMPVINYDKSKVMFYSDTNIVSQNPEIKFNDSSYSSARVSFFYDQEKNYKIVFTKGTFTGFNKIINDSIVIPIRTFKETELGIISINVGIEKPETTVIVQLLDDKYKILRENTIFKSTQITYNSLIPGKYYIRCVLDKNKNGKWDTGNLLKGRQPEEIIYFKDDINLKANWELNDLKIRIQ